MNWSELGLRQKLMLPIAVIGTLLVLLSAIQISSLQTITGEYGHVNEQYMPAVELVLNADRDLYQAQIAERSIALGQHSDKFRSMHSDNVQQVEDRLKKVLNLDVGADNHNQVKNFLDAFDRWRSQSTDLVHKSLSGEYSVESASAMSMEPLDKQFEEVRDVLDLLGERLGKDAAALQMDAVATRNSALTILLVLVSLAILVTISVAVYFPRIIARPVNELSRVLDELADGRGDLSKRMPNVGGDEIGRLGSSFNRFLTGMQQMIGSIQKVASGINGATQQLHESAKESELISADYAKSMELVSTANHEMGLAIQEVSANTQQVSEAAKSSDKVAKDVSAQFRQAVSEIQALAASVNNSGDVIAELEAETTSIASVLDVIKGIAEQTNLLALNAAIEAARAGEQGRGFAVVADEVRTLASKTQQSTGDINVMIERLRAGVGRAVSSMKDGQSKADRTVEYAEQSEANIKKISSALVDISDRILQIASAIEEQTSVIDEINQNLHGVNELSQRAMRSAGNIGNAVAGLKGEAENLRQQTGHFRV